jgi:hypothetical protein
MRVLLAESGLPNLTEAAHLRKRRSIEKNDGR